MRDGFTGSTRRSFLSAIAAAAVPIPASAQRQPLRPIGPRYPRGAQAPPRLRSLIAAQNQAATAVNLSLAADTEFMKTNPALLLRRRSWNLNGIGASKASYRQ